MIFLLHFIKIFGEPENYSVFFHFHPAARSFWCLWGPCGPTNTKKTSKSINPKKANSYQVTPLPGKFTERRGYFRGPGKSWTQFGYSREKEAVRFL
jgi:hypothetical protein